MTELHINPLDIPSGPSAYAAVEIDLSEFIDLDEFPIHDLGHPKRQELVTEARKGLEAFGCAHIPNFLTQDAITAMREEATRLLAKALPADAQINPYLTAVDESQKITPNAPSLAVQVHLLIPMN